MIVLNLLPLLWFKYAGFLADTWNRLTGIRLDFTAPGLPAGISFFTFQAMSYVIDVYRGETAVQKNLFKVKNLFCLKSHLYMSIMYGIKSSAKDSYPLQNNIIPF